MSKITYYECELCHRFHRPGYRAEEENIDTIIYRIGVDNHICYLCFGTLDTILGILGLEYDRFMLNDNETLIELKIK